MVITAKEAISIQASRESPDDLAADLMTDKVDKTIRNCSQQGLQTAQIIIPQWLPTVPVFDRAAVNQKVMSVFKKNGFHVYPDENGFQVMWGTTKRSAAAEQTMQRYDTKDDTDEDDMSEPDAAPVEAKSTVRVISTGKPASSGAVRLVTVKNA
jgi:hypothetical protein